MSKDRIHDTIFEDPFSEEVWRSTYKDYSDETVDDTMRRVAKYVASAEETEELKEEWEEKFYSILSGFKVTVGGRTYANAGTEWGTTLHNCVSGNTQIITDKGLLLAKDLKNKEVKVLSQGGVYRRANWYSYGRQELYRVTLRNGDFFDVTKDHEWIVTKPKGGYERVKTFDLKERNIPFNGNEHFIYDEDDYLEGIRHGLTFGDGSLYKDHREDVYSILNQFGDSRHLVVDYFDWFRTGRYKDDVMGVYSVSGLPKEYKDLPIVEEKSFSYIRGFIAGHIAADGCINSNGNVMLHSSKYETLLEVRRLAAHVGLPTASLRLQRDISPFDGSFSQLWKMTFLKRYFYDDKKMILKQSHKDRMYNSSILRNVQTIKVVSVENLEKEEEVFCCVEPETHTMTIGHGFLTGQCYVSPRGDYDIDSIEGIFKDILNQSLTLKSEGGWGQNFSWIRPRGSFIHGVGVESPGAIKYMEIYDKTSDVITAGSGKKSTNKKAKGKIRKGAQMSVLDSWHPDVVEFITAKQSPGRLSKFNMSVNCTDEFMDKVIKSRELHKKAAGFLDILEDDLKIQECLKLADEEILPVVREWIETEKWDLRFPDTTFHRYKEEWNGDLKSWEEKEYPTVIYKTISASWLWNLIVESTYNRSEPGVLFLDRANYFNPGSYFEKIVSTNPCGEQQLSPGNICCLGSINLTQFINDELTGFDTSALKYTTRILNRFLDNVNTLSKAPLPEYEDAMRNKRRIGIGILGWGSVLFMLKVRFGSDEADELREQVMGTIARESYMSSIDLAEEKGMFKYCEPKKHAEGIFVSGLGLPEHYMEKLRKVGIRNSSLLSIQPTGNTSIFANVVSGGLEPVFMPEYIRTVIINTMPEEISDICPKWYEGEWHETEMFKFDKEGDEEILKGEHNGIVYKIDTNRGLTKEVLCEDYGVRWLKRRNEWDVNADCAATTSNLSVNDHVRDLKGFARWLDSATSKTINVPNEYPFEDFKNIYIDAYSSGYVKGVTTYRAGTMTTVLSAAEEKTATDYDEEIILDDVKVPSQAPAIVSTIRAEGKKWYLTTIMDESQKRPIAFFVHTNQHEKGVTTHTAVDELIALSREKGIPEKWINSTLEKIEKDNNATKIARAISLNLRHGVLIKNVVAAIERVDDVFVGTFLFQIKKFLMSYIKDGEKVENGTCPSCEAENSFIYSEGCVRCSQCSHSKCG